MRISGTSELLGPCTRVALDVLAALLPKSGLSVKHRLRMTPQVANRIWTLPLVPEGLDLAAASSMSLGPALAAVVAEDVGRLRHRIRRQDLDHASEVRIAVEDDFLPMQPGVAVGHQVTRRPRSLFPARRGSACR